MFDIREMKFARYFLFKSMKERKPNGWWNIKENVLEEAKKYTRKLDFIKQSIGAHESAVRNGWLEECVEHMTFRIRWNYDLTKEAFLKYTNISDLQNGCASAYQWAWKNGFVEEFSSHMVRGGSLEYRYIYKYSFPDGSIYIGLTCCPEEREIDHLTDTGSSVYKYVEKSKLTPVFEVISDLIPSAEASKLEDVIIEEYKTKGFKLLNKVKGGGLGGDRTKWTFETTKQEALKYKSKKRF